MAAPTPQLISNYLAEGTHAARPASMAIDTGELAAYYETDTGNTYLWDVNGAAWVLLASSGAAGGTRSMIATGNTTGGTSSTTNPVNSLTLSGAGGVSVGYTAGTVVISGAAAGVGASTIGEYIIGNTGGATSSTTGPQSALSFSGAGGVTMQLTTTAAGAPVYVISGATTAASGTAQNFSLGGNTNQATSSFAETLTARSMSFTGGVSGGFDTNGVLIVSGAVPGVTGAIQSAGPVVVGITNTSTFALAATSTVEFVCGFDILQPLTVNQVRQVVSFNFTPMVSASSTLGVSATASRSDALTFVMYSSSGNSFGNWSSFTSTTMVVSMSQSMTASSSTGYTNALTLTYGNGSVTSSTVFSTSTNASASFPTLPAATGSFTGSVSFNFPFAATLTPGNYVAGICGHSASGGASALNATVAHVFAQILGGGAKPMGTALTFNWMAPGLAGNLSSTLLPQATFHTSTLTSNANVLNAFSIGNWVN